MTPDQRAALCSVRTRAWLLGAEMQHTLAHRAQQTGDARTVVLTAAVVTALRALYDHTAGKVEQGEAEGEGR